MDYIVTFIYGNDRHKVRVNNSHSEKDAVRSATVKARLMGLPNLENSQIKVREASYQKKS